MKEFIKERPMYFICPKCSLPLTKKNNTARCPLNHCYDRSREGYFNLLLGASGGTHGDNKEMINARRKFLSLGHYLPLAECIADFAAKSIHASGVILDAGLGEGYYAEKISQRFCSSAYSEAERPKLIGFDISRDAVKAAAGRKCMDELAVASSYRMPIADSSVDLLVNVFSPQAAEETKRVLKSGGKFIMAIPGEEHLFGLKSKIYDTPYKNAPENTDIPGFKLLEKKELRYEINLESSEDVKSLFMMTPYAYRTSKEGRERVLSLDSLKTEAHFYVLLYEKNEN